MKKVRTRGWKTASFDYTPQQDQQGTCLVLATAMNTTYEWKIGATGRPVYRFTFYDGFQESYDTETGVKTTAPGTAFNVRWQHRDNLTGFAAGVWGQLELAYAMRFGANVLNGDYPSNTMRRFGKPVKEAEAVAQANDTMDSLIHGGTVLFVSDGDVDSPWFHDLHAYRVLPAGGTETKTYKDDYYLFINPWSMDSAKGFTQGANDGKFMLSNAQLVQGGEAWGTFYIS